MTTRIPLIYVRPVVFMIVAEDPTESYRFMWRRGNDRNLHPRLIGVPEIDRLPCSQFASTTNLSAGKGIRVIDAARNYDDGANLGREAGMMQYLDQLDVKGSAAIDTKSVAFMQFQDIRVPDRSVPYDEMLRDVNELHQECLFEEISLSDFYNWEVAEIVTIVKSNEWTGPAVYEGLYNALERNTSVACLRLQVSSYARQALGYRKFRDGYMTAS
ncbi:uncharacterized protein EDB91DRAFT_1336963 [Suillus paluster]|uniref:uncharacterized protein n=1 Tax=Suillus paluster TaxID=48578 RepID=UPI001B871416|nr:uncharacterized protein EDB91DRAFT_1336963 [Suillus paluster]KAG1738933.1 hypothetical protein EDB91DRAFT_1336963 [Suillus paluster]